MNQNKIPVLVLALGIQLFLLFIANVWNAWIIIHSTEGSNVFHELDFFWPIANAFLLVIAVMIVKAKGIKGWKKYIPLFVALLFHAGFFFTVHFIWAKQRHNAYWRRLFCYCMGASWLRNNSNLFFNGYKISSGKV